MLDLSPLPWMDLGLCLSYPELDWFSEKRGPIEQAKAVCERCTVRDACLAYAKAEHIAFGVWGGTSPGGFDCSGFVWYVFRKAGDPIPRDMWGQYQSGSRVSQANLQPGDVVFFAGTYEAGLSHDGIYIGGGRFIHAAG